MPYRNAGRPLLCLLFSAALVACSGNSNHPHTPDEQSGTGGAGGAAGGYGGGPDTVVDSNWPNIGLEACEPAAEGRTLWVAKGDANGDGTAASPFNTVQAAADVAQAGDTVLIRGGTYRESVVPAASGQEGAPIRYKGCEGPSVINGADVVSGPWEEVSDKEGVFKTEITDEFESLLNQAEQLFVDGRMLVEARHPNVPFRSLDPLRARLLTVDEAVDGGASPDKPDFWRRMVVRDAEIDHPAGTWDGATVFVTARDKGARGGGWGFRQSGYVVQQRPGELVIDAAFGSGGEKLEEKLGEGHYHLAGTLAALDAPGEWFRDGNTLYVAPLDGASPEEHLVEIKRRDYAFNLSNRSYVELEDLTVFGATITTDHDSGNYGIGDGETHRGRNDVALSDHITLNRIHAKYINHFRDMTGWRQGQWVQTTGIVLSGRQHVLKNSVIEYSAGNGILVIGENNRVTNNLVHDTNYAGVFAAAICMGMESPNRDLEVDHNTVWATGFDGIMTQQLVATTRNSARVHHNRVGGFGRIQRDVGGIKVVGHHDARGARWDHNIVTGGDSWAIALYFDFATGWIADHNLVYDAQTGMNLNDGVNHGVYNNTIASRGEAMAWGRGLRDVKIINNILSDELSVDSEDSSTFAPNLENAQASLFVNPQAGDYTLQDGAAAAINKGEEVRLYTTDFVGDGPDMGAFEHGTEAWTAGADRSYRHLAPTGLTAKRQVSGAVQLEWSDQAAGEQYYYVERAPSFDGSGWLQFEVVAELDANTEGFLDESMETKQNAVFYRVYADRSMYSNTAGAVPSGQTLRLAFDNALSDSTSDGVINDAGVYYIGNQKQANGRFSSEAQVGSHSIQFNAADKTSVVIQNSAELALREEMGLTMWLKPQSTPDLAIIATKLDRTRETSGFSLRWQFNELIANLGFGTQRLGVKPEDGAWTFLAFIYADGWWRIYFGDPQGNLRLVHEEELRERLLNNDLPLLLGGDPESADDPKRFFNGLMDDVRLYHHGLSEAQLRTIMAER